MPAKSKAQQKAAGAALCRLNAAMTKPSETDRRLAPDVRLNE